MLIESGKRFRKRDLPEPAIHLIQSFLTSKQAAQTTVLSKSWRSAWLTRPDLDFDHDHGDFCGSDSYSRLDPKFLEFAERTLERYENSNLDIDSFRMSIKFVSCALDFGTLSKLVHRALKLGPTRLTFEFGHIHNSFDLPDEVFRNENLVSLTANWCGVNPNRDEVCCSRLRFLSLEHIQIKSRNTMFQIISSCPLIEKLSLCHVKVVSDRPINESVIVGDILLSIISPLHRLKSLALKHVDFDILFLDDLSYKLPSLNDLTLHISRDREEIIISSPTLERLDFYIGEYYDSSYTVHRVKLDVPSIRKLTFACTNIPDELSVTSNSRECESCVSVAREQSLHVSWFYRLSNFMDKFKFSRITLFSLHFYYKGPFSQDTGDIRGLPMFKIENLTIHVREFMTTQSCCALFDGLFQMCHPKVINIRFVHTYRTNIINFLGKILLEARDAKVLTPNQLYLMYPLNDLKEARAQVPDGAISTWRDVTLDSLADEEDSTTVRNYRDFRFHLNFGKSNQV